MSTKNTPSHTVWFLKDNGEGKKPTWYEVGAAWANADGKGFSCDTVFGKLVLREPKKSEKPAESDDKIPY